MLFIGATAFDVIRIIITSLVGIIAISAGMEGYFFTRMRWYERIAIVAAGLCLVIPNVLTDVIGVVLLVAVVILQIFSRKRAKRLGL